MARAAHRSQQKDAPEGTRQVLIRAAIKVFAKKGYEGASVKDICREAKVNVSLISYYFNGKDGLYQACLEEFGQNRLQLVENLLAPPTNIEDFKTRLKIWAQQNLEMCVFDKDLLIIIHRDFNFDMNRAKDVFKDIIMKIFKTLHGFFENARKSGLLRKDTDTMLAAMLFHGSLIHLVRCDQMGKDIFNHTIEDTKYRNTVAEHIVQCLVHGLINDSR